MCVCVKVCCVCVCVKVCCADWLLCQHHCRNCGQVVCKRCSGKKAVIPNFGYDDEVRVCDMCYTKLTSRLSLSF